VNNFNVVTFIITRRCNCGCFGCPVEFKNKDMSIAVFNKAAQSIFSCFNNIERVKFFGGEPLLNISLLKHGLSLLKSLYSSLSFEMGTNGLLLKKQLINYFCGYPELQININAMLGIKKEFLVLPNIMWNICIEPSKQNAAVTALERIAALSKKIKHRINLLPAYYVKWLPSQLSQLKKTARKLAEILGANSMILENLSRQGSIPLFNDGPAVDVDGKIYLSNICVAAMPNTIRRKLLCRKPLSVQSFNVGKKDLVNIFGIGAVASSYAAEEILWKELNITR